MPGAPFLFKNPLPVALAENLYSISFVFAYFVDETVEGNYQTYGSFSGFVW